MVTPLPFGSFENLKLLKAMLETGFQSDLKDKANKTPYDYACTQESGVLKRMFEEKELCNGAVEEEKKEDDMNLDDMLPKGAEKQKKKIIDFEADAQTYLERIQMEIDPQKFVPCDSVGKFNDDSEVMFDAVQD